MALKDLSTKLLPIERNKEGNSEYLVWALCDLVSDPKLTEKTLVQAFRLRGFVLLQSHGRRSLAAQHLYSVSSFCVRGRANQQLYSLLEFMAMVETDELSNRCYGKVLERSIGL